jgi:hypothetical protein
MVLKFGTIQNGCSVSGGKPEQEPQEMNLKVRNFSRAISGSCLACLQELFKNM